MIYLNKKAKKKKNLLLQFMSWCWYKVIIDRIQAIIYVLMQFMISFDNGKPSSIQNADQAE